MPQQLSKRVSVALEADGGTAICGFSTRARIARASTMLARSVAQLRRHGRTELSSIVISIEGTAEQFLSFQQAERGLARMHNDIPIRPASKPPHPNATH